MKSLLTILAAAAVCLWLLAAVSGLPQENELKSPALLGVGLLTIALGLYLSFWFLRFAVRQNEEWIRSRNGGDAHTPERPGTQKGNTESPGWVSWLSGIAASLALAALVQLALNGVTQGTIAAASAALLCGWAKWKHKPPRNQP